MEHELSEEFAGVESIFVRHRNVLMIRGHFPPIYTDYYLHLMQHGLRYPEDLDATLKDAMAMLTLHLVARPLAETIAWTVNIRTPRINLFTTGSSLHQQITGRCFTEDVRETDRNIFYSQTTVPEEESRRSSLEVASTDPLEWTEKLYRHSEQRPGRAFRLPDETFVLLAAQPDYDKQWFTSVDTRDIARLEQSEETSLLETRRFRWDCGCDLNRVLPALGTWRDKPEELFQGQETITVQCPRCAAKFAVTPDMI